MGASAVIILLLYAFPVSLCRQVILNVQSAEMDLTDPVCMLYICCQDAMAGAQMLCTFFIPTDTVSPPSETKNRTTDTVLFPQIPGI